MLHLCLVPSFLFHRVTQTALCPCFQAHTRCYSLLDIAQISHLACPSWVLLRVTDPAARPSVVSLSPPLSQPHCSAKPLSSPCSKVHPWLCLRVETPTAGLWPSALYLGGEHICVSAARQLGFVSCFTEDHEQVGQPPISLVPAGQNVQGGQRGPL
jgi:hypothetical protein